MLYVKKFKNSIDREKYIKSNFISPHIFYDKTNKDFSYLPKFKRLSYISSTQTGGQYINLGCNLFQNTDDIIIDIKFNMKGGGKDYGETSTVNLTKPSVLIGSISEADPYFGFVVRKADIGTSGTVNDNYVTMYTKWAISNSVYGTYNGDANSKKKYYPTYFAGNISGYEQTPINQIYEKRLIIDNLGTGDAYKHLTAMSTLGTYMFAVYNDAPTGSGGGGAQYHGKMWRYCEADVYYCKIYKGNTLIRDLVPMLRMKDNEPGLFDLEHQVFYPSQGDQPFVGTE